jgi:RHS repeat-associated protein
MPSQGTNNNGNVAGMYYSDSAGLGHTASYQYDGVNRLTGASATGSVGYNQMTFSYDTYGNMSCTPSGPGCYAPTYNSATNQVTNYTYSSSGNLMNTPSQYFDWDTENHMTQAWAGSTGGTYWYNALGQMDYDQSSNGTNISELYGADGALLWRYTGNTSDPTQRAFVPFQGRILAEYYGGSPGGTIFDHPDGIGSATSSSDYTGNNFSERLFYPFGEFWTGLNLPTLGMHQTFAQLPDYDPESDLYNTLNRHYSGNMGRWMSPDPGNAGADPSRPQTWNMYAYVQNNPTSRTDPSGLDDCDDDFFEDDCGSYWPSEIWNGPGNFPPPPPPPPPNPVDIWNTNDLPSELPFPGGLQIGSGPLSGDYGVGLPPLGPAGGLPCDFGTCGSGMPDANGYATTADYLIWGGILRTTGWACGLFPEACVGAAVAGGVAGGDVALLGWDLYQGYHLAQAYGYFLPKAVPVPKAQPNQSVYEVCPLWGEFPTRSGAGTLCIYHCRSGFPLNKEIPPGGSCPLEAGHGIGSTAAP